MGPVDAVLFEADTIIQLEAITIRKLRTLSTPQLRCLQWIGLTDDGWNRLFAELDRRGVDL